MGTQTLLATEKTPPPKEATSAELEGVKGLFATPPSKDVANKKESLDGLFNTTPRQYEDYFSVGAADRAGSEARASFLSESTNESAIIGRKFNYKLTGPRVYERDNLNEIQAQRQSNWETLAKGVGRTVGEFAINVAEMPGILLGAGTALATWDINKMTDNFWVNYTDNLKNDLSDNLSIYQKEAVKNGSVLDHLLSGAWWASEGASGIAFMASALVPGFAFGKAGKFLSMTKYLGRTAKGAKVLGVIDKIAKGVGFAEEAIGAAKTGSAAKKAIDFVNFTMSNTVFEAGVEAKSAQESYEELALNRFKNGEITKDQYNKLLENSGFVAAQTFGANMAVLMVPNMIMTRKLLGPRATMFSKIRQAIKNDATTGLYSKVEKVAAKEGASKLASFIGSNTAKTLGGSIVRGVENVVREGVIEEIGQNAITDYYGDDYINKQLTGVRARTRLQTYTDAMQTTDGQLAAVFAGILSAPMSMFGAIRDKNAHLKAVDKFIIDGNNSINFFKAKNMDIYKVDPKDPTKYLLEDGNLVPDDAKIAALGDAWELYKTEEYIRKQAEAEGDFIGAEALAIRGQIDAFLPFIEGGKEGMLALEDMLKTLPSTALYVQEYNKKTGENLTVDQVVKEEMSKAKELVDDLNSFSAHSMRVTPKSFYYEHNVSDENKKDIDGLRGEFNFIKRAQYVKYKGIQRHLQNKLEEVTSEIQSSIKKGETDLAADLTKDKKRLEATLEAISKDSNLHTSFKEIEKDWSKYYNQSILIKKVNSKEVTDYLDDFIKGVKRAKTYKGILKVIDKAKKDGLILPEILPENLPKALMDMASSDNLLHALAAHKFFYARDIEAGNRPISSEAISLGRQASEISRLNFNKLYDNAKSLLDSAVQTTTDLREEFITLRKEAEDIEKEITANTIALDVKSRELLNIKATKGRMSFAFKQAYKILLEEKKVSLKIIDGLSTKLKDINTILRGLDNKITYSTEIYKTIVEKADVNLVRNWLNDTFRDKDKSNTFKTVANNIKIAKFNKKKAIPVKVITSALLNDKELLNSMSGEVAGIIGVEARRAAYLEHKRFLEGRKAKMEERISEINKIISRFKKYVKSGFKDEVLTELQEQIRILQDGLLEIDELILELTNKLEAKDKVLAEMNDYTHVIKEIIDIIVGRVEGKYQNADKTVPTKTEEKVEPEETLVEKIKKLVTIFKRDKTTGNEDTTALDIDQAITDNRSEVLIAYLKYLGNQFDYFGVSESTKDKETKSYSEFKKTFIKAPVKKTNTSSEFSSNYLAKEEESNINKTIKFLEDRLTFLEASKADKEGINVVRSSLTSLRGLPTVNISQTDKSESFLRSLHNKINLFDKRISDLQKSTLKGPVSGPVGVINNTNIKQTLQEVINEQEKVLQEELLGKAKKSAKEMGTYISEVTNIDNETFIEGEDVFVDGAKRKVRLITKSETSNVNVVLESPDGKLSMVSFTQVSKTDDSVTHQNGTQLSLFNQDTTTKEKSEDPLIHLSVPIVLDSSKSTTVYVDKNGSITESSNAFYDYLLEPRDKTKDTMHFQFNTSGENKDSFEELIKEIQGGKSDIKRIKWVLEKLAKTMPIGFRIKSEDYPGSAGAKIPLPKDTEESNSMELQVRRAILSSWYNAGAKRYTSNGMTYIKGVVGHPQFQGRGILNIDPKARENGGNIITDLQGITIENMELFAITHQLSGDFVYAMDGSKENYIGEKGKNQGVVGIYIKTVDGKKFPLMLNQKKLKGTSELELIMDIIVDIISKGNSTNLSTEVSSELLEKLKENSSLLYKAFKNIKNLTYGNIYNTIMIDTKSDSQFHINLDSEKGTITIGGITYSADNFNRDTISVLVGEKYIRTGFTDKTNSALVIDENKDYLNYLVNTKVVSSNIKSGEHSFVGEVKQQEGEDKYVNKISIYIGPDNIIGTNETIKKNVVVEKGYASKQTSVTTGKKVFLNKFARIALITAGIKIKKLSQEEIISINSVYSKGDVEKSIINNWIKDNLNKANKETGDTEVPPCN